ncbi:MAG: cytochrome c maturation protein CcmE [Fimbriimonadaceae bacterium]|nr:cytochrome c maturation protein CcmE [Fimbriimonadaceae bacterium]
MQTEARRSRRWWVGLVVIGGLGWLGLDSFKNSMATYSHDFAEVARRSGQLLQVPGVIDKSYPQRYDTAAGVFEFGVLGVEDRSQRMVVRARTVKPSNFDQASQVISIGVYQNGVFEARQLLVKCPSKEQQKLAGGGGSG